MTFPSGWTRRAALTINSAQVVGSSGTHSNFPVLLTQANLPSEMLDKDGGFAAQMGGGDIRFTSDVLGASPLPCHVVEFITANDPASATAIIYVGLNLPTGTSTTIYAWYKTATRIEQPKYNANTDADGFQGSDYVWTNYDIVLPLGGFGGLRNLKQANAAKNIGRYGNMVPRSYVVAANGTGNTYCAFPSMVRIGDRLYVSIRESTQHEPTLTGVGAMYYSDDMGRTWTNDVGLGFSDPSWDVGAGKLLLAQDGTLWTVYTKVNSGDTLRAIAYRKSVPPYSSWSAEVILTSSSRATHGSKPIQLASGRIVIPVYEVNGSAQTWPYVFYSDNGGSTWTSKYLTTDGNSPGTLDAYNETTIAEDPTTPNSLIAIVRRNGYQTLYRSTSADGGQTWTAMASVAALAIDVGSDPDMPELLYCNDGDLLLAYAKDRVSPEYRVVRSTDNGATWDSQYAVVWANDFDTAVKPGGLTGGLGGYLTMAELTTGLFAVAYYYDNGGGNVGRIFCEHFTKIQDGALNVWTDTSRAVAATVGQGLTQADTYEALGNGGLDYWNQVHTGGAFTISGWAKFNQTSDELFAFCGSSASSQDRGFFFGYENRVAVGSPNRLHLMKNDGVGGSVLITTAAISADTSAHRYSAFGSAGGTPTFLKDATEYAGASGPITGTAGNAELGFRIAGVANSTSDLAAGRLSGWAGMWSFAPSNLGADYEKTRYNSEATPASFVTAASPVNAVPPVLTGSISVTSLVLDSYTLTCPAATDDVGVTGYQYRINGGAWTTIAGAARTVSITGRTPGSTDSVDMRAFDAASNYSEVLSTSVELPAPASLVTEPFRDYDGNLLTSETIPNVLVHKISDRSLVLSLSDQVTHATTGVLTISSVPVLIGTACMVTAFNADGTVRGAKRVVAA